MPGDLILNSLEIQRFRCFRDLRIERLGRVNLIVGENNVGKSTLLEALRLFARPSSLDDLLDILASRNEVSRADIDDRDRDPTSPIPLDSLFFGRRATTGREGSILIGPSDSPEQAIRISLDITDRTMEVPEARDIEVGKETIEDVRFITVFLKETALTFQIGTVSHSFMIGKPSAYYRPSKRATLTLRPAQVDRLTASFRDIPCYSIEPNGVGLDELGRLWDDVSLSSLEQDVTSALRIISPEVDRVALKASRDVNKRNSHTGDAVSRIPFVKVKSFEEPIPLRALGDGMNRLFGIALGLVHARGGLLLVDEIENGIHYSVQADLWRLIFETAARLNVQVFATTHSYDCIKAFEEAARESEEEGVLVRLARKGDRTLVGEFDERELEIAIEGEIEVR